MRVLLSLLVVVALFIPSTVSAAWAAIENFDSYTTGASISGDNGGSGWSAAWTLVAGTVKTPAAPAGGQGGNALSFGTTLSDTANRTYAAAGTSGTVYFRFYMTSVTTGQSPRILWSHSSGVGGTFTSGCFGVTLNITGSGTIDVTDGATYNSASGLTFTANAWHTIAVRYGFNTNKFSISIDNGAFSADFATNLDTNPTMLYFDNEGGTAYTVYYDDISPTNPTPAILPAAATKMIINNVRIIVNNVKFVAF